VLHHLDVGGIRLTARRSLAAPEPEDAPVVLVAGLGLSGRYMLPLGAELARSRRVWVPDLPGYGLGGSERRTMDIVELADVLVTWMTEAGITPAALVGNSMGCQVAVEAAARHPDRVTHLVLEGPTIDAHARSTLRQAVRFARDAFFEPLSIVPLQAVEWTATGPRRLVRSIRFALDHPVERRLADVACPALVVRGEHDQIVSERWAAEVARALPSGSLRVVPEGSHAMCYSRPRTLAALVERHLTSARRPLIRPPTPNRLRP
jgi:pimeloyl-ACP methyl ester carboxylesterase